MAQLIPFLHFNEEDALKQEISVAPYVAVIFDGTFLAFERHLQWF